MWRSLIVIVFNALTFLYLSKYVPCSEISFEELKKKFEWTESLEEPEPVENGNENSFFKFPPRSLESKVNGYFYIITESNPIKKNFAKKN